MARRMCRRPPQSRRHTQDGGDGHGDRSPAGTADAGATAVHTAANVGSTTRTADTRGKRAASGESRRPGAGAGAGAGGGAGVPRQADAIGAAGSGMAYMVAGRRAYGHGGAR